MAARNYGQYCGVVTALELVGERWALLIVRDLLVGPRRYTDLKSGLPRIPTNILSSRLKELQDAGIARRVPLAHCGLVYELTPYGRELEDVVLALGRWGFKSMGTPDEGDTVSSDSLTMALRTAFRADVAAPLPATTYEVHIGDIALSVRVRPDGLLVIPLADSPGAAESQPARPDVVLAAGPGIRSVISGELSPGDAIESGIVHILEGEPSLLERFAQTFHLQPRSQEAPAA